MEKTAKITPTDLAEMFGGISVQAVYKYLRDHNIDTVTATNRRRFISSDGIRAVLETKGYVYPKKNISFQIVKGGTGKTSLAYSLSIRASHYGARVLAIDFDQQGNLTRSLAVDARDKPVWLHVVRDRIKVSDTIIPITDTLDIIPSNLNNSRLDVEITGQVSNLRDMIRDKLAGVRDNYDLVIMDCPPALNKINAAVACGSDYIIIPINPDPYAMDGLDFTISELERIRSEFKTTFEYRIIWNRYDARERLGVVYMHELAKRGSQADRLLPVVIRTDSNLKNAIFAAKSIFDLPKKSVVKEDIDQFAKEVLGINQWTEEKLTRKRL